MHGGTERKATTDSSILRIVRACQCLSEIRFFCQIRVSQEL